MIVQPERAKRLEVYLGQHLDSDTGMKEPIELDGTRKLLPVMRLPIEMLRYSIRNGRFRSELLQAQETLGRELTDSDEDQKIIQDLLIENNPRETEDLRESLQRMGRLTSRNRYL